MTRFDQIEGKRCAFIFRGATGLTTAIAALVDAYGLTGKIKTRTISSGQELKDGVKNRTFDVGMYAHGGVKKPMSLFLELNNDVGINFLDASPEMMAKVITKYPYYSTTVMKAGVYKGQDYDVHALTVQCQLLGRTDLPDDFVYEVMKLIWDNPAKLHPLHYIFKEYNYEEALNTMSAPYHAGAVKYWKKKGLWTSEMEKAQQYLLKQIGAKR